MIYTFFIGNGPQNNRTEKMSHIYFNAILRQISKKWYGKIVFHITFNLEYSQGSMLYGKDFNTYIKTVSLGKVEKFKVLSKNH